MRSLLQQLKNNESVLLLYLANELSVEDRAEVEQMLSTDQSLRTELERLKSLQESFHLSMGVLDTASSRPASESASARKISQMMARQAVLQAIGPVAESLRATGRRLRIGGWMYPVAIAATVLIAVGWWGRLPWSDHASRLARHNTDRNAMPDNRDDAHRTYGQDLPVISLTTQNSPASLADSRMPADLFELSSDGDGDRSMVAVAAASVDVSFNFDWDVDAKDLHDQSPQ